MEETLSTIEKVTRGVFGITKMIYRKKTKNPVHLVNPVKDIGINLLNLITKRGFDLIAVLCGLVALCEK